MGVLGVGWAYWARWARPLGAGRVQPFLRPNARRQVLRSVDGGTALLNSASLRPAFIMLGTATVRHFEPYLLITNAWIAVCSGDLGAGIPYFTCSGSVSSGASSFDSILSDFAASATTVSVGGGSSDEDDGSDGHGINPSWQRRRTV